MRVVQKWVSRPGRRRIAILQLRMELLLKPEKENLEGDSDVCLQLEIFDMGRCLQMAKSK